MSTHAWKTLSTRLHRLGLNESDLEEQFVRSGGKGGQNVNKVATCVLLRHRPSGLAVRCEEERSQSQNRFLARQRLAEKFEQRENDRKVRERQKAEKLKRQKRGRNRTAKERMLKTKHHRADIKKDRQSPRWDE